MKKLFLVLGGVLILGGCGLSADETTSQSADKIGTTAIHALQKVDGAMDNMEQTASKVGDSVMEHVKDMMQPHIVIEDQKVEDATVVITGVNMFDDGWVVIHATKSDGTPGVVIGHAPVKKGGDTHIAVKIDPTKATPQLIAMAHEDNGAVGVYEFPGADKPLSVDGSIVMEPFMTGDQYPVIAPEDAMMGDMMEEKKITYDDVSKHATKDDCWFVVGTTVYDVTPFIAKGIHPGKEAILAGCGKDATTLFESRPMGSATPHSQKAREMLKDFKIGVLAG